MKVYKLEILVIDHDEVGPDCGQYIENARFPNHCVNPIVMSIEETDIGEWSDEHPLNKRDTYKQAYLDLKWDKINGIE